MKRFPDSLRVFSSLVLIFIACLAPLLGGQARRPAQKPQPSAPASPRAPKLVLVIVIDQFRADYLDRFADQFGETGFRRLMRNGAFFANAHYRHASTYTACGHAAILSGSIPALTGIISNEWHDRDAGFEITSVTDANYMGIPSGRGGGPTRLMVTTLGDQLKMSNNFQSRVVGVALKDRGAVLPAGKSADAAYWFDTAEGIMQTSAYYMRSLPAWVKAFNERRLPDGYFGKKWELSRPESDYARSDRDDAPYEMKFPADGNTFPHTITGGGTKPNPRFYDNFTRTPWGNDYLVEFTQAMLENEPFGKDDIPDVLSVSFSSMDLMGHWFGPNSREAQDMVLRLDLQIARLLDLVDQKVGLENTTVVLTADHGASPIPEYAQAHNLGGRRIKVDTVREVVNKALTEKYGEGPWIAGIAYELVYLDLETIKKKNLNRSEVEKTASEAAMTIPGVTNCFTRTQILNGPMPPTDLARKVADAFHPQRSGDIYMIPEPFAFFDAGYVATTHGTPYGYDTHVPVLLMGRGIRPGRYQQPAAPSDIAPTLAAMLGVEAPSGSVGRVLHEAFETPSATAKPNDKPKRK